MVKSRRLKAINAASACRTVKYGFCILTLAAIAGNTGRAESARFDLTGPKVEVRVTRAGVTLPISSVPNLQVGDRLWLHPDLPTTQSVRYLMVLAFLRGTTNPPPDNWFVRIQTWDKKVREEGVEVTVPDEAQQAVLFLAPVTGGDFSTLRSAVQGRPGIFVRASQDLAAAGFEQARIEKYIASMRELSPAEAADPKQLQDHSNLIAATLALKPNADCAKLPPDQQYTCLTQSGNQTLLDDGHGQSIIDALTGNTGAGLISQASYTQLAGAGVYSAYVGAIVDLVHIMGSLHTAQYQYIPAIAFPQQQSLNLRLNTPPSFHNPKSVIVIGLPSVQQTVPPPLRAADPNTVSCLQKPGVVLPVEGAPLVFSTGFAHDLVLHIDYPAGARPDQPQDVPLTADAFRGGLVLATEPKRHTLPTAKALSSPAPSGEAAKDPPPAGASDRTDRAAGLTGTVRGFWGFDTFTGPTMPLQDAPGADWKLAAGSPGDDWLIAGKDRHVLLTSTGTACVQSIELTPAPGKQQNETWKLGDQPNTVDVALDVPAHDSGTLHLDIRQFGDPKPATVSLVSYNEPAKLDALLFHAGDTTATLTGTSVDQVRQVALGGLTFKPAGQGTPTPQPTGKSELQLTISPDSKAPTPPAGDHLTAHIALQDGRTLSLPVVVEGARPAVTLIGHADVPSENQLKGQLTIQLASQNDLPVSDALIFSLKSAQPFPRTGTIEIASPDNSLRTILGLSGSSVSSNAPLVLEDPHTILATLQPLKVFGPSAFGPIRLRAIAPDGTAGEWLPLATLVRLPQLTGLSCPVAEAKPAHPKHAAHQTADVSATDASADPAAPASDTPAPAASIPDSTANPPAVTAGPAGPATANIAPAAQASAPPANPPAAQLAAPPPAQCTLSGSSLYFVDSISTTPDFADAIRVPEGFVGSTISVPPPTGATYYLRLRDDPAATDTVNLPAGPL